MGGCAASDLLRFHGNGPADTLVHAEHKEVEATRWGPHEADEEKVK